MNFAEQMRERRARKKREVKLHDGSIDRALEWTYNHVTKDFGPAHSEIKDGDDHLLCWWDEWAQSTHESPALLLDLGKVRKSMMGDTQRSVMGELIRTFSEWCFSKHCETAIILSSPSASFKSIADLEGRSTGVPVRVVSDPTAEEMYMFVRSSGKVDWFGRSIKDRPVIAIRVP